MNSLRIKVRLVDGELMIPLPRQLVADTGWSVGQQIDVSGSGNTIMLRSYNPTPANTNLEGLVTLVHEEALELFEGDEVAKERWMENPAVGLANRIPNEMLSSVADIESLRLLISRLERGSLP